MARARKTTGKSATGKPATGKRPIEQCDHKGQQRKNNPPVGLVSEATDRDAPKRRYAYDPHLDPTLTWAGKAEHTSFEAIDFYQHARAWSNRLIAGDSLLVMNSRLQREGMAGKVQMVYIDPPYGIRFERGPHKRAAVKIVDDRGIESPKIIPLS